LGEVAASPNSKFQADGGITQRDFRNIVFPFLRGFGQIDDLDLSGSTGFCKEQIDMLGDLCEMTAIRRLNLSGIPIGHKNLEHLDSSPSPSFRKILETCDFVDLTGSHVSVLFPGWIVDLKRRSPCIICLKDGSNQVFSHRP
jgi:hypothetical protein